MSRRGYNFNRSNGNSGPLFARCARPRYLRGQARERSAFERRFAIHASARPASLPAGIALLMPTGGSAADNYPSRPIRIVVPTQAGAAQDIMARLLQPYLERSLGQPIIVENRSGASTMIGTDAVAKAAPDGYTLLIVPTTFTVNAALNPKLPSTCSAISSRSPSWSRTHCCSRSTPGAGAHARGVRGAGEGAAGQAQLRDVGRLHSGASPARNVERARRHQDAAHPHRGGAPAALAVASGEVQLVLPRCSGSCRRSRPAGARDRHRRARPRCEVSGSADCGRVRVSGFEAVQWLGLLATGGTPKEIVQKINAEVNRALREPDLTQACGARHDLAAGGTPDEFKTLIATEIRDWKETAARQYQGRVTSPAAGKWN